MPPAFYVRILSMKDKNKTIKKIVNCLNANDFNQARKIIENDLKRIGAKCEYFFYLALITKELEEKKELYSKAIEANPHFLDAYINRGLVNNELGEYSASVDDYDKAITLDNKCALAYNNRGYTKFKQGDLEGALADYNKAILLNPKLQMALDNKARLFASACMEDDKDFSEKFYLSLGIHEVNSGSFAEAIKNFDEALKFNPELAIAYFYKGIAYHSLCNNEKAFENYSKAIEIDRKMIDAYFNRGQLIVKTNPKQALDDFVSAAALDNEFIDAYYAIAAIQKTLGQYEEAVKNLDRILELDPQAVNAKALKKLILTKYIK